MDQKINHPKQIKIGEGFKTITTVKNEGKNHNIFLKEELPIKASILGTESEKFVTSSKKQVITYGNITIDMKKSTLQYKNETPITISLRTNEIIFLVKLLERQGDVLTYEEIVKEISSGSTNELPSRRASFLKRNLRKFLLQAGMDKKEISKMIVSVRNIGFKIVP